MIFWQFTIKSIDELEIVSNQNISVEMFLLRLLYLKNVKKEKFENNDGITKEEPKETKISTTSDDNFSLKNKNI